MVQRGVIENGDSEPVLLSRKEGLPPLARVEGARKKGRSPTVPEVYRLMKCSGTLFMEGRCVR